MSRPLTPPGPAPGSAPVPQPAGPQPAPGAPGAGPLDTALLPPPIEPAEFVERAQPPLIDPRVKPQGTQPITGQDGKPIDPNAAPPDQIAIDDLGPDGKATLEFDLRIDAVGRSPARSIDYLVDGRKVQPTKVFDQPVTSGRDGVKLSLAPGPHRFTIEVENDLGVRRTITRDIFVRRIAGPRTPRLKIVTIAPSFQDTKIPRIAFAENDVRDVHAFLKRYLVSAENVKPIESVEEQLLEGAQATFQTVQKAIEFLQKETFGEGDLLVLVIETHFLNFGTDRRLVVADGVSIPPKPAIAADELAQSLGVLAARGCKVLVLLDGVHTASSKDWDTDVSEWVRNLRDDHNVVTFVASKSGPSEVVFEQGHGAFAQAILLSIKPTQGKQGVYSLNDFGDVVIDWVLRLTQRRQQAGCYVPETISGQFPIIDPQAPGR
jgi:hypothetical protein